MPAHLIPLSSIRSAGPCESGWRKFLTSLGYEDGRLDPDRLISIGDVARSNGAQDAFWVAHLLPISAKRDLIKAVMPAARRAENCSTNERVRECNDAVQRWSDGDDGVDLNAAVKLATEVQSAESAGAAQAAWAAAWAARSVAWAAQAAWAAAWAARSVAWAARSSAAEAVAEAAEEAWTAAWAARSVAWAAEEAIWAVKIGCHQSKAEAEAATRVERNQQVADIIAVFPLRALLLK